MDSKKKNKTEACHNNNRTEIANDLTDCNNTSNNTNNNTANTKNKSNK